MDKVREFITSLFKNKRTKFLLLDRKELSKEEERIELAILLNSEDIVTFQEDLIFEEKTKQLKNSTGKVIFEMSKTTIASSNNQIVNNIANYLNSIVEKEWSLLEQDCSEMLAAGGSFEGKDLIEFSLVMEDLGASNLSFTYSMAGTFNSTVRWEKKGFVFNVANGEIYEYPGGKKVTDKVVDAIASDKYDCIILNYANPDMVGHTGVEEAAVNACKAVDDCLGKVMQTAKDMNAALFVTADHGNSEQMWDYENNQPHTAHTLNPVVFAVYNYQGNLNGIHGKLADIAPTILKVLNISQPKEMTGESLLA